MMSLQELEEFEQRSIKHAPARKSLPVERAGICHKFSVAGYEGYIQTGEYPDGRLGEIFVHASKEGSTVSGLLDAVATLTSIALQYGVPLEAIAVKFVGSRFEPSGIAVGCSEIIEATSLLDYLFKYLLHRYGNNHGQSK